jgi:hypothetical protein
MEESINNRIRRRNAGEIVPMHELEIKRLEAMIRSMTDKERAGLEVWVTDINNDRQRSLSTAIKDSVAWTHWWEVEPGQPWGYVNGKPE